MILVVENVFTLVKLEVADKLLHKVSPEQEIRDFLSVKVPGARFAKRKGWDGYTSFYKFKKFPTGFLPMVIEHCLKPAGIAFTLIDQRELLPKFIDTPIYSIGDFTARPHQQRFIDKLRASRLTVSGSDWVWPRGINDAATNAGKNLISALVFANLNYPKKCLFLLHNKGIFSQAFDYFSQFFTVGMINDKFYDIQDFTIAMQGSLLNMIKGGYPGLQEDLKGFNVLIIDEAHRAGSSSYVELITAIPAGMRLFISGTPMDMDNPVTKLTIQGYSGQILDKTTNQELIDAKVSRKPIVFLWLTQTLEKQRMVVKQSYDYEKQYGIVESALRMEAYSKIIAERPGKKIMLAFRNIEHGIELYEELSKRFPNLSFILTHGKHSMKQRVQALKDFSEGKGDVLIASHILKEGINMPNIQVTINCMGGKSKIDLKQFIIGRSVRANGEDEEVELHDFYDSGDHLEGHSRKRALIYKKEGFELRPQYPANRGYIPK